jgi:uncharacterized protein (DUF427 family)
MKEPGPDHPITIAPVMHRVVVRMGDTIVADTQNALELVEASYKPVFYIPRSDARMAHYEHSERRTHCPYKGDASYFHLVVNGSRSENAVWTYETPFPAMTQIADHVAFYPDRVTIGRE